jgi:hypothetical protein
MAPPRYDVAIVTSSDPVGTTSFFIPGVAPGTDDEARELKRLLARAEAATGVEPSSRRIQGLFCRIGGRDCMIEVGRPDPIAGAEVVAIIELGRHLPFGVFTANEPESPALLVGPSVYSVTEFS